MISEFSASPLVCKGEVVCRPIVDPVVTRRLFIAVSSERPTTTAQRAVVEVARDLILESVGKNTLASTRPVEET